MSLYLKYRPQDFQSVVGQEHVKRTLQSALASNSMAHAYLFCGSRGTGKTSMARIVAKGLNCLNLRNNEPCNECQICAAINGGRLVDVIEIDAASNRGIDEIRELREKIVFAPSQARRKVYIIDEVHMLTKEAFNALLKTLEEPPSHTYFILATTEAHKIPETIISRTQQFGFSRISLKDITDRLKAISELEGVEAEEEALGLIAKLSNGGLRDAIGLLEQMMASGTVTKQAVMEHLGLTGKDHLERLFHLLMEKSSQQAILILNEVKKTGSSLSQFLKDFIGYLREQMLIELTDPPKAQHVMHLIDIFLKAKQQIDLSPIPELPVEMAILRACDFQTEPSSPSIPAPSVTVSEVTVKKVTSVKADEPKVVALNQSLSLEEIKKQWPRVLEKITTPFVKMSLMNGQPEHLEGSVLTLTFNSASFMEKLEPLPAQTELLSALEATLQFKCSLKLIVRQVSPSSDHKDSASVIDMAAEVFGVK